MDDLGVPLFQETSTQKAAPWGDLQPFEPGQLHDISDISDTLW